MYRKKMLRNLLSLSCIIAISYGSAVAVSLHCLHSPVFHVFFNGGLVPGTCSGCDDGHGHSGTYDYRFG